MCLSKNEPNFSVKTGFPLSIILSGLGFGCLILIGDLPNGLVDTICLPELIVIERFISLDIFTGEVLIVLNIEFKVDSDLPEDVLLDVSLNLEKTDDLDDVGSEESNESMLEDESEKRCEKSGLATFSFS